MLPGELAMMGVAGFAVGSAILGFVVLLWITRPGKRLPDYAPPITVLKPLKGIDEGLEANLRSFFELDYPDYQLLFGVAEHDDPCIPVVERLMREYPDRQARLIVGSVSFGLNPKVASLAAMLPYRRHEFILVSDSNVRVRPSYLRETAAYLADPAVGLVTNMFVGVGERSFGAALENLQLNGFIAGGIALAKLVRQTCVVGKSMLMPVRALEAIGGFASVRNLLAEDQAIGLKIRRAGYSVVLSHHVIENVNVDRSVRWFLNRHSRWYKIRRRMAMPWFLLEPCANLAAVGLVWALSGDTGVAWGGLLGMVGLVMARDALQTRWLRGSFPSLRHLLLSPVKDLFLLPMWVDALVDDRVQWRGHKFVIGSFTRLRSTRASREARRRLRHLKQLRARHEER